MEKLNQDLVPELVAYALTPSFSHVSHQCGHNSLAPIAVYNIDHEFRRQVMVLFLQLLLSNCVVSEACITYVQYALQLCTYIIMYVHTGQSQVHMLQALYLLTLQSTGEGSSTCFSHTSDWSVL